MDFALVPDIEDFRQRYRAFVTEHILPVERDRENYDEHENIALPVLEELRGKAKAAGLWAPQMPKARGGQGLPVTGMAACYEEMGRSIFGPAVFNCAAPDDGNMLLLEKVASEAQKARWLQPIVDGRVRSAHGGGARGVHGGRPGRAGILDAVVGQRRCGAEQGGKCDPHGADNIAAGLSRTPLLPCAPP